MKYVFDTTTTMKSYNSKKWWIERDIINQIKVEADNLRNALELYREIVNSKYSVYISENALKHKDDMFITDKDGNDRQIGYIITGSSDFDRGDYSGYSKQYVDLWTSIYIIQDVDFTADTTKTA